ncbi:MAG: glycosyl transferase [Geitlerinemataceae cyanobacterium]
MSRPTLYLAITNHGFGHAVRAASIAAEVQKLDPEILLILATTAPRWLLESYIPGDFIYRPRAFDIGVVQPDSLTMDFDATLEALGDIRDRAAQLVRGEADFLKTNQVDLILGDIPPLLPKIAKAAGVDCWMTSNFGWDFIYRAWGGEFIEQADWIAECFGQCDRLFRLPMHEEMSAFPNIEDVGLTGGTPKLPEAELCDRFDLRARKEKTILLSFGGLGLATIPYDNLKDFPDWNFITFDRHAPDLPNLRIVRDRTLRPVDFMPICGRVVSKPGYSTFAEAMRLDVPIVTLTREGFAEAPILVEGIRDRSEHQIISPVEFFDEPWTFLNDEPRAPRCPEPLDKRGSATIAAEVVRAIGRRSR